MPEPQDHSFVDVLEAEHRELEALLATLSDHDWSRATPAAGWSVLDTLSHLADTEEIARHTATGGPRSLALESARHPGGVIPAGVAVGAAMAPADVLTWFREASAYNRAALRRVDTAQRVPWGLGMGWRAFVTARLMEAWAHGLDIRAAVEATAVDTDRLEHVVWLSYGSLPYAFKVGGVAAPEGRTLRLDLTGPNGEPWTAGPADATDVISGPAGLWCRRAVQRASVEETGALTRSGPLAELAFRHARCFL